MDDQEEMEEAAEMEIDRILFEITAGMTQDPSSFSSPFGTLMTQMLNLCFVVSHAPESPFIFFSVLLSVVQIGSFLLYYLLVH